MIELVVDYSNIGTTLANDGTAADNNTNADEQH